MYVYMYIPVYVSIYLYMYLNMHVHMYKPIIDQVESDLRGQLEALQHQERDRLIRENQDVLDRYFGQMCAHERTRQREVRAQMDVVR